jgi:glutathione-specific gamma-glutamylcyclotransferase
LAITRDDLAQDRVRARMAAAGHGASLWSEAQLEASLRQALVARPTSGDAWVFAYGSLIWNPMIHVLEARPAMVRGHHRAFCLHSRVNRGTPERPGLVLGLDRGGACAGLAYRIAVDQVEGELRLLWRREMLMGSYRPRWLTVRAADGARLPALAFLVNRQSTGYAGRLPEAEIVRRLRAAEGLYGTGADYLTATVAGLHRHGLRDRTLERLARLLHASA